MNNKIKKSALIGAMVATIATSSLSGCGSTLKDNASSFKTESSIDGNEDKFNDYTGFDSVYESQSGSRVPYFEYIVNDICGMHFGYDSAFNFNVGEIASDCNVKLYSAPSFDAAYSSTFSNGSPVMFTEYHRSFSDNNNGFVKVCVADDKHVLHVGYVDGRYVKDLGAAINAYDVDYAMEFDIPMERYVDKLTDNGYSKRLTRLLADAYYKGQFDEYMPSFKKMNGLDFENMSYTEKYVVLSALAMEVSKETGISSTTLMGMALQETQVAEVPFSTLLAKEANNLFGLKDKPNDSYMDDPYVYVSPEEENGVLVNREDYFRQYDSYYNSFKDVYNHILELPDNYSDVLKTSDPFEQVQAICNGGWATASTHGDGIRNKIENYGLIYLDNGAYNSYLSDYSDIYSDSSVFDTNSQNENSSVIYDTVVENNDNNKDGKTVIILIPGHGGSVDPGTIVSGYEGADAPTEAQCTWKTACKLKQYLENILPSDKFDVVILRGENDSPKEQGVNGYYERVEIANKIGESYNNNAFLANIHYNCSSQSGPMYTLYKNGDKNDYQRLSESVISNIEDVTGLVRAGDDGIMRNNEGVYFNPNMMMCDYPGFYIEVASLTQANGNDGVKGPDYDVITSDGFYESVASAFANTICGYYGYDFDLINLSDFPNRPKTDLAYLKDGSAVSVEEGFVSLKNEDNFTVPLFDIVESGESYWSIADEYGISYEGLEKINDISADSLQPGDVISIGYGDERHIYGDGYEVPVSLNDNEKDSCQYVTSAKENVETAIKNNGRPLLRVLS